MRVLMISKALVAGTSQRKLEEIAKCSGVELTLVTPPYWQSDDGSKQVLERLYTNGYRMIVTPIKLNGNFHLHYYPQLGQIMREVQPEIVHIDEEPYNLATFLAMRLARQHKGTRSVLYLAESYRDYPLHSVSSNAIMTNTQPQLWQAIATPQMSYAARAIRAPSTSYLSLVLIQISTNAVYHFPHANLTILLRLALLVVSRKKKGSH